MLGRELVDNALLGHIRVLVLIDEHIPEALRILLAHLLVVSEQFKGVKQQVVEVHCVGLPASCGIGQINLIDGLHSGLFVSFQRLFVLGIHLGIYEMVFCHGDDILHRSRFVDLVIEVHLLDNQFDERPGICLVVDSEIVVETYVLAFHSQDTGEDTVERAHIQPAGCLSPHQLFDSRFHFLGSLVGESECQKVPWLVARL